MSNKKRAFVRPVLKQNIFIKNYFSSVFSKWITNLGVVPLFLFEAFLFCPAFLVLFALLVLVILVRETMIRLLYLCYAALTPLKLIHNEAPFLPALLVIVKGSLPYFLSVLFSISYAQNGNIWLPIGGQEQINISKGAHYSLGNREIVKTKLMGHTLLIRGDKVGTTDLKIWGAKGDLQHIPIYVLSRSSYAKQRPMREKLENGGLTIFGHPTSPTVRGKIESMDTYRDLWTFAQNSQAFSLEVELSKTLQKKLIGKIYKRFFDQYLDYISCQFNGAIMNCAHSHLPAETKDTIAFLEKNYWVQFSYRPLLNFRKNFEVKMKIFKVERMDGEEIKVGIDELNLQISELLNSPLAKIREGHGIILKGNNLEISTLASPKIKVHVGKQATIRVGSDIPYPIQNKEGPTSYQWKFVGLKIKFDLSPAQKGLNVHYQTSLSSPTGESNSVQGSFQESILRVLPFVPSKLFEIDLVVDQENKKKIPLLGDIPLLGLLFSSNQKSKTYKKIVALASISPLEDDHE